MSLRKSLSVAAIGAALALSPMLYAGNAKAHDGTLHTLMGILAETAPQLQLDTIQDACQITTERRTNFALREKWTYVADTSLYKVENGDVILYLGNGVVNPILQEDNIVDATKRLIYERNYFPAQEDIDAVVSSLDTVKINLKQGSPESVRLQGSDVEWGDEWIYLEIETDNYSVLNDAERRLAEVVYCQGSDFMENMKMLNEAGVEKTRIYVLNPDYVKGIIGHHDAVSRVSWISSVGDSIFSAVDRHVDLEFSLRGVLKNPDPIGSAYQTLFKDPQQSADRLTPETAAGLSQILADYLTKQNK